MLTKSDKKYISETIKESIQANNGILIKEIIELFNATNEGIDAVDEKLSKKIDAVDEKLSKKIDAVDEKLSKKIDVVDEKLGKRIDSIDQRIDGIDQELETIKNRIERVLDYLADDNKSINNLELRVKKIESKVFAT